MGQEKIAIREADLGPVIARADHWEGAIEVNRDVFYRLPPSVQEFVLCHEVCHLRHDEWDEGRTNALASELYLRRAATAADRAERKRFLSYLDGNGGYSNFAWAALASVVPAAVQTGFTLYGYIKDRNSGWYSWSTSVRQSNIDTMLTTAFEKSRRSGSHSAADYFWELLYNYDHKDADLDAFLKRSGNEWVRAVIAKYEKRYGFGFDEVTPIDLKAFPLVMVAIGLVAGFVVYKIIKKLRK